MRSVLITGAAGKIGSVLRERLSNDYRLFLVDRAEVRAENSYIADLSSMDETIECFQAFEDCDCVVHLAADPRVDAPWDSVLENNIAATYNVFEASRRVGIERIVFASSNHVTGRYEVEPEFISKIYEGKGDAEISPEDELRPDGIYGVSKIWGEQLGRYYHERFGMSFVCLRIGTFNEADSPLEERHRATWISHRDLSDLVRKSIEVESVGFGVYYAVSDNDRRIWKIENAKRELGYRPRDNAEEYWEV